MRMTATKSIIIGGFLCGVSSTALAQTAPEAEDDANVIVVTGSSIRGVAPVGSDLVTIDRNDIEASSAVTTADLLIETPQVFNSGISSGSRNGPGGSSNTTSATAISLRGLGPSATLTLFNGHRPVPQGTTAGFVDPSAMPTIAIERLEIVADGASAIYGSDAVAGVVNLITRKSFDGVAVNAQLGFGDDFSRRQIGAMVGKQWSTGGVTLAYQYGYRGNIAGRDRDYYRSDLSDQGGTDYRINQCSPGNLIVGGVSYAIPEGGATPGNLVPGTENRCDVMTAQDIIPQQEYNSAYLTFNQELGHIGRFFVDAYATRRDVVRDLAPPTGTLVAPNTNAYFVAPAGTDPASVTVEYAFDRDFGSTVDSTAYSKGYQIYAGSEFYLSDAISLTVGGSYGWNRDESDSYDRIDNTALRNALASSDPNTAFNPFGTGPNNPAVIAAIRDSASVNFGTTEQWTARAVLDGALLTLPGGDLSFALGGEYLDLSLITGTLRGKFADPTYFDRDLGRNVRSAFAELYIPIFGPSNARPGLERLEINLAGRYEDYSDVGSTTNPKVGVNWEPFSGLVVRGSYGTSFRAPSLTQVYTPAGGGLYIRSYNDPLANNGAGGITRGVALYGDNLNLKPETAKTWSLGLDYQPEWLPRTNISLNYFNIVYEGQIINFLQNLNVLTQEQAYASIIVRNPSQSLLQGLIDQGLNISGGTEATVLATPVLVYASHNNLGVTEAEGLDFQLRTTIPVSDAADLRIGALGTYYFSYKVALTPQDTAIDRKNDIDYPLTFRARAYAGIDYDGFDATIFLNYSNSYNNANVSPVEPIDAFTTVDLNLGYRLNSNARIGVQTTNLFDVDPPYVNAAPVPNGGAGFDPQVADPSGRVVSLVAQVQF